MWAERFCTRAEGLAGRNGADIACCVTLTWEKTHYSSLGDFTPPASHRHAHFCKQMIYMLWGSLVWPPADHILNHQLCPFPPNTRATDPRRGVPGEEAPAPKSPLLGLGHPQAGHDQRGCQPRNLPSTRHVGPPALDPEPTLWLMFPLYGTTMTPASCGVEHRLKKGRGLLDLPLHFLVPSAGI